MESNDLVTGTSAALFSVYCPRVASLGRVMGVMGVYKLNPDPSGSILHFQMLDVGIN